MTATAINVRQLNFYVRSLIEGDPRLSNITVCGEISNFKNHFSSGHLYFTLKDEAASIRCVMFRSAAQKLNFNVEDGKKVILKGRVSLYEKDGQYQFYAEEMTEFGHGDINAEFERIKEKLSDEGLFDIENKRKLPIYPKNIAVVTSDTGAAVQDIINILSRRWPIAKIILCSVRVQGENAVPSMLKALDKVYDISVADVIIIGRGGGSIEDLWAFNSEELARKIYESPIPVISAVGHETDFTICDFVADLRAPTPSAAAELAVPDIKDILQKISKYENFLYKHLDYKYNTSLNKLNYILNSSFFKNPVENIIYKRALNTDKLTEKINNVIFNMLNKYQLILAENSSRLDGLSPLKSLSRGFAAVSKDDKAITNIKDISVDDNINITFSDGVAVCNVKEIKGSGCNE